MKRAFAVGATALLVACEPRQHNLLGTAEECREGMIAITASSCAPVFVAWVPAVLVVGLAIWWWVRVASFLSHVEKRLDAIEKNTKRD